MEVINKDTELDIIYSSADLFAKVPRAALQFRKRRTGGGEGEWRCDPMVKRSGSHAFGYPGENSWIGNGCDSKSKAAIKHKVLGYQLFNENYIKKAESQK